MHIARGLMRSLAFVGAYRESRKSDVAADIVVAVAGFFDRERAVL
ncbi:hypothetical protein SAMN02927900_00241 [Rhizobium mongolense subsp. loessense]|uniref:Uncharacterized protein n=1 Tax=Rhizobium mongolense subsp. loessense TaxID=158890 RepID=A0A1G4PAA4_9HYPH|nr:hypothetical protein SAMN02927900_00241 [Rhizobium mongolense subsp. loessense]